MHSLDFHNVLQKRGTFFCYSGLLSEDVISTFTDIIREGADLGILGRKLEGLFVYDYL